MDNTDDASTDLGPNTATKYLAVYLYNGTRPFFLRVTGETARLIKGIEVNRDGDRVTGPGFDERAHVIERTSGRMVPYAMSRRYARLCMVRHGAK